MMKKYKHLFWIFAILKYTLLGTILFLLFHSLSVIHGERIIGLDTQLLVSIAFPLISLILHYISLVKP